jgi:hypothetical protein
MKIINDNQYYTSKELAESTGLSIRQIQRLSNNDSVEVVKQGGTNYYEKKSADKWVNDRNQKEVNAGGITVPGKSDHEEVVQPDNDEEKQSDKEFSQLDPLKFESDFHKYLHAAGFYVDLEGIFINGQQGKQYMANFMTVEYLHNKMFNSVIIRVIQFDDTIIDFTPSDLISLSAFQRCLLSHSSFLLNMNKAQFGSLISIILAMDNGKYIKETEGFGHVADNIYNLGNKVIVDGIMRDFTNPIWRGQKGFCMNETDMISISYQYIGLKDIFRSFNELYGNQAVLILGFATATLFFQQYMEAYKHFPLLYIQAGSGKGKSGLSELMGSLFGIKEPFASVNCAGNSTKIGIESKAGLLNDLPLFLNELTDKEFEFIKSRYDGQGSVKYSEFHPGNISERSVNGSTVITTVVEPTDKQIISRCVFINLDVIELKKEAFDAARRASSKYSQFVCEALKKISFNDILEQVKKYKDVLSCVDIQPRIKDNYALIGGCFEAFLSILKDTHDLPDAKKVKEFIIAEMLRVEDKLNPLDYFIRELEWLTDNPVAKRYIFQDEKYLYFNFNGIWKLIKSEYKKKYLPFMTAADIKELLRKSKYIAKYGDDDFKPGDSSEHGKPIYRYPKKIRGAAIRCIVLVKKRLPGYFS